MASAKEIHIKKLVKEAISSFIYSFKISTIFNEVLSDSC